MLLGRRGGRAGGRQAPARSSTSGNVRGSPCRRLPQRLRSCGRLVVWNRMEWKRERALVPLCDFKDDGQAVMDLDEVDHAITDGSQLTLEGDVFAPYREGLTGCGARGGVRIGESSSAD